MDAAERVFLEKGVENTTIEDITLTAGVSKGAFYLHFSSKADILQALRTCFIEDLLTGIVQDIDKQDTNDWPRKLISWSTACGIRYLNAGELHHLIFTSAPLPPRGGLSRNILIEHLTDLLSGGNMANAWSVSNPRFTAIFLFNALHGVVNDKDIGADQTNWDQYLSDIQTHFLRSVGIQKTL